MKPWAAMMMVVGASGAFYLGARRLVDKLAFGKRKVSSGSHHAYDKAKYHSESVEERGLPPQHAGHFASFFLSWLIKRGLTSRNFASTESKALALYRKGGLSIHDLFLRHWDGSLVSDMLSDEGNAFAMAYFDFQHGNYLVDYEQHLQKELPSSFHVPYTPENEQRIHDVIDQRYTQWKQSRAAGGATGNMRELAAKARQVQLKLNAPSSRQAVEEFELRAGVRLPDDYRNFLLFVADGGMPPCRLTPLLRWSECYAVENEPHPSAAAAPCLLTPELEQHGANWLEALGVLDIRARWDANHWCPTFGTIAVAEIGCGAFYSMVMTGAHRGRIFSWGDHYESPPHFVPQRSFSDWLEFHLDQMLAGEPVHFLDGRLR